MSIAIVTDSACNITPEQAEELGLYLLPLEITIDEETYKDGFEINTEEFYEKMATANSIPKTSMPQMGDAYELYEKLSKEHDAILSIHLGSNVSGTVQSLKLLANDFPEMNVTIFDTQLVSVPAGYLVLEARRLVKEGKNITETLEHLELLRGQTIAYASVHSLDNLVESGRVPAIVGTVAKLAKIKPIISIKASENKGLEVIEKVRTSKRANKKLIDLVLDYTETLDYPFILDVAHGNIPKEAAEIRQQLQEHFPEHEIQTHLLTGVIGAHSGPEIIGIFIAPDLNK